MCKFYLFYQLFTNYNIFGHFKLASKSLVTFVKNLFNIKSKCSNACKIGLVKKNLDKY